MGSVVRDPRKGWKMKAGVILMALACACDGEPPRAQVEDAVMMPIMSLLDAMRTRDSVGARAVFHTDAQLIRLPDSVEGFRIDGAAVDGFVAAVGDPERESWDEPIWDWDVKIDGNLALVWAKYAFYRGGEFSHCGVDSFQLALTDRGWKIVSLAYSRRHVHCELPPSR